MDRLKQYLFLTVGLMMSMGALALFGPNVILGQGARAAPPGGLEVSDVDNPARDPVSLGARLTVPDGGDNSSGDPNTVFFTVPADKRLVVEFVDFLVIHALFDEIYQGEITTTVGARTVRWFFGTFAPGCKTERCAHTFSQPVRIYADPGTEVRAFVVRETKRETDIVDVNISGHLV